MPASIKTSLSLPIELHRTIKYDAFDLTKERGESVSLNSRIVEVLRQFYAVPEDVRQAVMDNYFKQLEGKTDINEVLNDEDSIL